MPDMETSAQDMLFDDLHEPDGLTVRAPRKRTYLNGMLVYGDGIFAPDGSFTQNCIIRDLSDGGAKIVIAQRQFLPQDLYLIVVKHAVAYQSRLVWLHYPARGLKFLRTYSMNAGLPEDLKYLQRLWAELGTRSGVAQLPDR